MKFNREVLKGYIDKIILSLLRSQDLYGYELAKQVRERSNNQFELKEGTMYVALKRLEKKELIESYWDDQASEGGRRKYYRILLSGIQQFELKKKEWQEVIR